MTTRQKTVEYHFDTDVTGLALATRRDLTAITVYLPETTRTFRSVIVEVFARDTVTSATTPTSWMIGIKLGAVAFSDDTVTLSTIVSTEQKSLLFTRDVTAYFAANFGAGASQTCQVGIQIGALATINLSARLLITYDYDDAATTHVKTVRIPLESIVGPQPTSLTEVGTNQVPLLDSFLPETSKVFRMISFQVEGSEGTSAATDAQIGLSLDAGAESLDGLHENGLITGVFYRFLWRQDAMTTSAVHAFKMRTTVSTMPCPCANILLVVTYEFDPASTAIMNSLVLPMNSDASMIIPGGTLLSNAQRMEIVVPIAEPGTITLAQSAVRIGSSADAVQAFSVMLLPTTATARVYSFAAAGVESATFEFTHRLDSGGALPSVGLQVGRGENRLGIMVYSNNAVTSTNPSGARGTLYLNYTSGRATSGPGTHAQTRWQFVGASSTAAGNARIVHTAIAPTIPEASVRFVAVGPELVYNLIPGSTGNAAMSLHGEYAPGEAKGDGWKNLAAFIWRTDVSVVQTGVHRALPTRLFYRWTGDPDRERMNPTVARRYRSVGHANDLVVGVYLIYTYHTIVTAYTGTVYGAIGSGAGVTVKVYRADTDEPVGSAVTTSGGAFSFSWYDGVTALYATARQDAHRVGRSNTSFAGTAGAGDIRLVDPASNPVVLIPLEV